jgi:L-rhamnose mutarotase
MTRYCFALDLKDDPASIASYEEHHKKVWPEILESLKDAGVVELEIYLTGNRLFMIMETNETFSLENKSQSDADNPIVQEWERLMWMYQQALPGAKPGVKWILMKNIFTL